MVRVITESKRLFIVIKKPKSTENQKKSLKQRFV